MFDGLFDLVGGGLGLVGDAWYTEQERSEHELAGQTLDVQRHGYDTQLSIAELGSRSQMIAAAQGAGGMQTLAVAGIAVAAVLAGAYVLVGSS